MKNQKIEIYGFDEFEPKTLTAILKPLAELLAIKCSMPAGTSEYQGELNAVKFTFGDEPHEDNLAFIWLSLPEESDRRIDPYLYCLLLESGSENEWMAHGDEAEPARTPIRFSVEKRTCGADEKVFALRYLAAKCREADFDPKAAKRQVALLVDRLSDPSNVPEIPEETRHLSF